MLRITLLLAAFLGPAVALAQGPDPFQPTPYPLHSRLAVAWDDNSESPGGFARAMQTVSPWGWLTPARAIDRTSTLRYGAGRLLAASFATGRVAVISPTTWNVERFVALGDACGAAIDVAAISATRAYATCANATSLVRFDPSTGVAAPAVDLSVFADDDGVPDLGWMARYGGRLLVQVRRFNPNHPGAFQAPAMIAVVDLATETLVDCDPQRAGVQAIELAGTPPKFKMQIIPTTRRLLVSATGGFFDHGGIEMIDLVALRSLGLVIREEDDQTGADLGAFIMVTPERGYLVYSTDLLLSSHLKGFGLTTGVDPGLELHVALNYFVPALAFDPLSNHLFVPEGGWNGSGVHVFNATSGVRLTTMPTPTSGDPTDVELLPVAIAVEAQRE